MNTTIRSLLVIASTAALAATGSAQLLNNATSTTTTVRPMLPPASARCIAGARALYSRILDEIEAAGLTKRERGIHGPDLLGGDWDEPEALRRLRSDPARPIVGIVGPALRSEELHPLAFEELERLLVGVIAKCVLAGLFEVIDRLHGAVGIGLGWQRTG